MNLPSSPDVDRAREHPVAAEAHQRSKETSPSKPADDIEVLRIIVEALTTFETKDQERILRWACEKLGLQVGRAPHTVTSHVAPTPQATSHQPVVSPGEGGRAKDIRTFMEAKQPRSDNQFAAAVAYYYRFEAPEAERKIDINAADLQDATRKVGRNRLGDPDKTLRNAHGQGLLDKVDRGRFAVSTVGENLVAMALPQGEKKTARKVKRKSRATKAK